MPITIFISHTSSDKDLAEALIRLLRAALPLKPDSIRCTSVHGYKLPTGANVDAQLRNEVVDAITFIALLTKNSLDSTYVLFELGARWGVNKPLFPLMARGITGQLLNGPLCAINAKQCSLPEDVYQFLGDMAASLVVEQFRPQTFQSELRAFVDLASSAPSQSVIQEQKVSNTSNASAMPIRGVLNLSPREICEKLRIAAPLQMEELAKGYIGYVVDWETTLSAAYPPSQSKVVDLHLNPWEPEGYDVCIRCSTTLERNPELLSAPKMAKLQLRGKILKVDQFHIDVETSELSVMSEDETNGTRIRFIVPGVRGELGMDASASISDRVIEDCIKAQIRMGRPAGIRLVEDRKIVPEVSSGTAIYKLLVLYASVQLIQTSKIYSDKQRREHIFKLEGEIHDLENDSMFLGGDTDASRNYY